MYIYIILCLMHFIQKSNVSTTEKYGFMLNTRNVYNYIMYLVSIYCEFIEDTYIRLIELP